MYALVDSPKCLDTTSIGKIIVKFERVSIAYGVPHDCLRGTLSDLLLAILQRSNILASPTLYYHQLLFVKVLNDVDVSRGPLVDLP